MIDMFIEKIDSYLFFLLKAQILKILSVIYRLVQSNSYATKRSSLMQYH